jgi:hypothetical protein
VIFDDRAKSQYDLENWVTHEVGHLLGLPDEPGSKGAMGVPQSSPAESPPRTFTPQDVQDLKDRL